MTVYVRGRSSQKPINEEFKRAEFKRKSRAFIRRVVLRLHQHPGDVADVWGWHPWIFEKLIEKARDEMGHA